MPDKKICPFMCVTSETMTQTRFVTNDCVKERCQLFIINNTGGISECAIVKAARMLDILARRGEDR